MSLLHLRTFVEVFRRGSISEAARVLRMTQPAVSQHVASLESQLGRPLFERHARGVRPTAIADDLAASLGSTLDTAEAALAAVRARSAQLSGTVHIAGPADLPAVTAPDLRILRALVRAGAGWTVLPNYLCMEDLIAGRLTMIDPPVVTPRNSFYLVWAGSALRHRRVAFARQELLRMLKTAD